jgi:hypothetical protein
MMLVKAVISTSMVVLALAVGPPNTTDKVATARWMASNINWGVLSTTSTRIQGALLGEAFGNPYSFADADSGVPYFYASDLDASMVDAFIGNASIKLNPQATLAISEASLHNATSPATQPACRIGTSLGDPENPPCARLVLSGKLMKLDSDSAEYKVAYASLIKRHPSFKLYPPGHDFFVAKMQLDGVWLIDFYGGAAIISPKDYLAPSLPSGGGFRASGNEALSPPNTLPKPKPSNKVATARWMAATLDWGALVTTSSRSQGSEIGEAFGNPYSFADAATGVPYFYASDLDASMIDIFQGNASAKPNPKASFALSEAALGGTKDKQSACEIGSFLGDPETPTCSRLVLSGSVVKLVANSTEEIKGRAALFAKHPSFAEYPPGHDFFVAKMEVEAVWLIDAFGGAAIIPPKEYLAADSVSEPFLAFV